MIKRGYIFLQNEYQNFFTKFSIISFRELTHFSVLSIEIRLSIYKG